MFMPQRKGPQRTNSSSSISSSTSSTSTSTITTNPQTPAVITTPNGDSSAQVAPKKKPRGGFWPASSKAEASTTGVRGGGSAQSATAGVTSNNHISPVVPSQSPLPSQQNGTRSINGQMSTEPSALLALLPMNGTFERKQINVPFFPDVLRVGRQTNAKTVPTPLNGFFDSKVLSRQHAEVWAERNGKVWIRDVKSSNGTFVNGQRLSPENRDSEPHELHQHDTLELGIDIVSEDQKTIVHHKVSAKVEYVGLPGSSNNVLDLNFGDLDPSHGGPLLASPMSSPMTHSRSRPGGSMVNGRTSSTSSITGNHLGSLAQQRQMNFWGAPLNVEHLVKTLSVSFYNFDQDFKLTFSKLEMKAAQQQAQDLEQTGAFLGGLLDLESHQEKPPLARDSSQSRQINGRMRALRLEPSARFAEPPAPPPQQPLPEKPDVTQGSPSGSNGLHRVLRADTARPNSNLSSPTSAHNSQILTLVEALSVAKKELDAQSLKVRQLEEMLQQEKIARESAEERARRLEQGVSTRPATAVEEVADPMVEDKASSPISNAPEKSESELSSTELEKSLQLRLDHMVADMQRMKNDMEQYQARAETAETDADQARLSLSGMIKRLRAKDSATAAALEKDVDLSVLRLESNGPLTPDSIQTLSQAASPSKHSPGLANGHVRAPSRLPEQLERAMATILRDSSGDPNAMAQSAPYVSMLGVVLIGVCAMAYLNSWQRAEK